jgi:putative addiction module component (TIGR02574 family)
MTLTELEAEALKLSLEERARLAETLLESLDELAAGEHEAAWTKEALRRDAELDEAPGRGRAAEDVFRDAFARAR